MNECSSDFECSLQTQSDYMNKNKGKKQQQMHQHLKIQKAKGKKKQIYFKLSKCMRISL